MIENGVVEVERSKSTSKIDLNAPRVGIMIAAHLTGCKTVELLVR